MRVVAAFFAGTLALAGAAHAQPAGERPIFVTLGTGGGPVVQVKRGQPANAVVVGDAVYLFDVGEGAQRQMKAAGLPLGHVRAIFISHHHLDHVGGLQALIVNRWIMMLPGALAVTGPPGTHAMVDGIVAASHPVERAPLSITDTPPRAISSAVHAIDIPAALTTPTEVYRDERIRVLAVVVDHYHKADGSVSNAARSYAYRIEAGGRAIVFSGDTGPSVGLERLAHGADLLVCEVMDRAAIGAAVARMDLTPPAKAGFLRHMDLDHLTPPQVGAIAARAGVRALVLTHLVPGRDEEAGVAGYLAGLKANYSGPVRVASDGDRF